ncbi:MAG: phosphatidylserine/phosphatidylglycerophosphate/cardiolipin synthase family protein [Pseudobdellovibrionaceae bacterium]
MILKPNWDTIQLYFSGDDYFRDLINAIHNANEEIILESYIFNMDPIGIRVLEALSSAQQRGVKVQILVDGVGSFNWLLSLRDYCFQHHLHFRIYHPLPLRLEFLRKISWRSLRRILFLLKKANKRNHRKVAIIDKKVAFLGSLNVSQVHSEEFMGPQAWRDTGIQVTGGPLAHLRKACLSAWVTARMEHVLLPRNFLLRRDRLRQKVDTVLRLNSTLRWRYSLLRDLNRRMRQAQSRILITNAYFLPRRSVLRSLIKASQRGVYVGLCLPSLTDVPAVRWASRSLFNRLLRAGVHIYEYQSQVLHAKTLIIDDWATVGSHNLNHRSLTHDLEVEVVLTRREWVDPLVERWDTDIRHSHAVTSDELGQMTWLERAFARLVYWFRYWL